MRSITLPGLVLYCVLAGLGLFLGPGLSSPLLFPWVAGYLFLLFRVSYDAYVAPPPLKPFPIIVLGILLLNFLVQVTGGIHSSVWTAYFLFSVVIAAFSPPARAYGMVALILAIEAANLLRLDEDAASHWHVYLGVGLSLAGVSAASSHLVHRIRRESDRFREDHDRLIAEADALDPLTDANALESLTRDRRRATTVHAARQQEITFNGLIEMIFGFIPAHTYALFLKERRDGGEQFVLRAIRSERPDAVLPVGTALEPGRKMLVHICAEQHQPQYLSDLSTLSVTPSGLGCYRPDVRNLAVRSFLVLPVEQNDEVIAVLAVDSLEPGAFSAETQDMLEKFSPFFIQVIEKTRSTLDLKTRADHFGALHEISADLNSSLRFDEIMEKTVPRIVQLVPTDYCAVALLSERDGAPVLRFASLRGYDTLPEADEFPIADSAIIGHMRRSWEDQGVLTFYSGDLGKRGKDIGLFPFRELQKPVRSLYGRLLVAKDDMVGVFFLASLDPDAFSEYQRDYLLDTLMNQVSLVAYNSLLYRRIEDLARTDGLTGLLNHRTFMEKLAEKYRELDRTPHSFSILLMDIDKFKNVNDTYGHPVGDIAIKAVARVLRETVRASDFAARYGGEEFAVGMIETDAKGAAQMAERVRKIMEKTVVTKVSQGDLKVTLSIGVATFPEDTQNKAELVSLADQALYHAKRSGRNRVCPFRDAPADLAVPEKR